jgi:predicted transcriptional regulator
LLSFKKLSFSFTNEDLANFLVMDRSNAAKIIGSLEAKGYIKKFSIIRIKRVISISPLLEKYLNEKEVYSISPEELYEDISISCGVDSTPRNTLVMLGYIYTKDTKNIKQDIPNSSLEVKTIKLSSTEKIMWQEMVQTFSLFGINLDKISQDTFDFVRRIPNDAKARQDFTDAVIYTVLSQDVKNPYNYLKAAYNNCYFSKLTEEQRSQVLNICQLLKREKTTLQEFLLEGGLKRVKETAQALGISFKNMITTVDIITQRVGTARKTFHDFELKYKIEYMTWKEELHKPSF